MSKLRDLARKGMRLIVAESEAAALAESAAPAPEREIPPDVLDVPLPKELTRSELPADVTDFAAVYQEAGIELPLHGYGVDKVAEMLQNKRLSSLTREVRAAAVLAALEAAQVPVREVIQDGVARDRALDAFESAKQREVSELRTRSEARVLAIQQEMEAYLREKNAEIESLKNAADAAERAFTELQGRKRREEDRLFEVVAHFLESAENPISTSRTVTPPAGTPPDAGKA